MMLAALTVCIDTPYTAAQDLLFVEDFNELAADSIVADNVQYPDSLLFDDPVIDEPEPEGPRIMTPEELVYAVETADPVWLDSVSYKPMPLPESFFGPVVYTRFELIDTLGIHQSAPAVDNAALDWINRENSRALFVKQLKQNYVINHPRLVRYNESMLPEPPKEYRATVDPQKNILVLEEITVNKDLTAGPDASVELKRKHWMHTFNGALQFSQAYVSPNWYQGGNNNLNMLGQLYYNVKLNQEFHPNLLFDFTAQYKLGINSAPDDSLRNYSISDDLLQLNTTFGIKAAKRWYYSFTGQFKTQLLNSYTSNTRNLRSAFLSPAELTAGVGMTYNYANKNNTFTFDASLAPISYNLKICTNDLLDETAYGIRPGGTTVSNYGSTTELKLFWKLAYNISFRSRLFSFSDYSQIQADWENTLMFEINRFLTTQIYAHMRYDSRGVRAEGTKWKKLQIKEILSIGFAYKFSSI